MSAHAAIYSLLSGVTELTGGAYAGFAPKGTSKPYAVFHRISDYDMAPHMGGSCGLFKATYQINVEGTGPSQVKTAADAVRAALCGVQGTVVAGVKIRRISLKNERDDTTLFDSSETENHETQMDFDVSYLRPETP